MSGVSLAPATASVKVGATTALRATVSPGDATDKAVSYVSSKTAVASVSADGVVTGVSAGSTTITVTTHDGSKTASTAVTVTAA
ncbi:Ig-like domain-containing protein [Lacticaseibacillus paracasei]|uniref:Ig-like domain-containing protein n=1 Tax=Lacticaseibacillus paracasei TaxID=1597 RepID=UPI0033935ECD